MSSEGSSGRKRSPADIANASSLDYIDNHEGAFVSNIN